MYENGNNTGQQYRVSGFKVLPPVIKNLLIINVLFFLADMTFGMRGFDLSRYLGLHYITATDFHIYQYVTYMFMHGSFSHLFFNMFALWMFGNTLENMWGSKRFLLYYMITGIGAGLIQTAIVGIDLNMNYASLYSPETLAQYVNQIVTIGASGAVFGLLLAFGMSFPNMKIYVYFLLPIKAKWFVIIYGLIELYAGIGGSADGVAHFAHLGGMLFGLALILYWKKYGSRLH